MDSIRLLSPAKVNLTLEVSDRREDGYHEIDSVIQVIDLADELTVTKAPAGVIEIDCGSADVPSGAGNVVYAACRAFFETARISGGARCEISKRIPVQAGLGGGSSNAAAVILALDTLYDTALPRPELAAIAAGVGSDAVLFVYGGTVRVRGRGELVEPLPDAPGLELVIVKADIGVSTAWAYAELDEELGERPKGASDRAERAIREHAREALVESLANDFDPVVSRAIGEVGLAKKLLDDCGARKSMLCGSGSAVFGVFNSRADAESAARMIRGVFRQVFVARGVGRGERREGGGMGSSC
jgi:4-diphosphocytidyl-2-C-methyl-D-erythritol kinase